MVRYETSTSPGQAPPPPRAFELFKTGLFKFPWFPTPVAQVMIKCPGFARGDDKVSNRSTHNRYFKCKMRRFIVFWQEVEIHRNEVKLLDANNTKLEADIRWTLSLRSKRFRLVSEQRKTEERDSRFWPREKWNNSHFSRGLWLSFLVLCS